MRQVFLTGKQDEEEFKRQIYVLRKVSTHKIPKPGQRFYICSLSNRIVVYKGQFTADQLWKYFTDLNLLGFSFVCRSTPLQLVSRVISTYGCLLNQTFKRCTLL
ncbi:putative glutamate synthase [NADPH] [Diaphorina citri]|uniref:glutamate synthase (ferredoxin) n=1 Tax=Diaphorina citri TaxID=121845 RepID=A0A3Q0INA8_DIACI|nr:putative glutamate synthase [NADPH] [Diaphorina citri]